MTGAVLVVGYGNALRSDDGVGWYAAERLADDPRLAAATVFQRHQLTPELALDFSEASLVVLVDASTGLAAGTFTVQPLDRDGDAGTTWSHHVSAASLVALADELYGHAPEVFVVSCGVASFEVGEGLSAAVEAALPAIVDAVAQLIASKAPEPTTDPVAERTHA